MAELRQRLACPFAVRNSTRYGNIKGCTSPAGFPKVQTVIQHVFRDHLPICRVCKQRLLVTEGNDSGKPARSKVTFVEVMKRHLSTPGLCVPREWKEGEAESLPEILSPQQEESLIAWDQREETRRYREANPGHGKQDIDKEVFFNILYAKLFPGEPLKTNWNLNYFLPTYKFEELRQENEMLREENKSLRAQSGGAAQDHHGLAQIRDMLHREDQHRLRMAQQLKDYEARIQELTAENELKTQQLVVLQAHPEHPQAASFCNNCRATTGSNDFLSGVGGQYDAQQLDPMSFDIDDFLDLSGHGEGQVGMDIPQLETRPEPGVVMAMEKDLNKDFRSLEHADSGYGTSE